MDGKWNKKRDEFIDALAEMLVREQWPRSWPDFVSEQEELAARMREVCGMQNLSNWKHGSDRRKQAKEHIARFLKITLP